MGSTFTNFHVRTTDATQVCDAILATAGIAWVSAEPQHGWVSVYPYRCEARSVAEYTKLPVLSLSEYDGDIAQYELYENGALIDEFDSDPDYWVGSDVGSDDPIPHKTLEERRRLAGNPAALLPYCLPGTQRDEIHAALGKTHRDLWIAIGESTGKPFDEQEFLDQQQQRSPRLEFLFQQVTELQREFETPIPPPPLPPKPYLDKLDSGMVLGALEELLGLKGRLLYSGTGRIVWEEGFPLEFVGGDLLNQDDKDRFLAQSIPDQRVVPHLGHPLEDNVEPKLAAMRHWLSLGANPSQDDDLARNYGMPLLMRAVSQNSPEAVELLLQAGANPNVSVTREVFRHGSVTLTPMMLAEQATRKEEIVNLLRRFGASHG